MIPLLSLVTSGLWARPAEGGFFLSVRDSVDVRDSSSVVRDSVGVEENVDESEDVPEYFVKHLVFPEGAGLKEKVEMASRLVPSPEQLAWQGLETTAFLHFGINTFTGREWGDGSEDPALFNPTDLDADQWIRILKAAGFRMVILTAKHHDGFCLWPTKTTEHSVASSPWKDGKGDVVREVRDACDRYGMKFGVYLSPWDRNAECYGDSPAYNAMFLEQLTELLTDYGEIDEVWFDGANGEGPNGKRQWYNWNAYYNTIKRLQPGAVMAVMGDDVRWVGNEKGMGRETEWSATVLTPGIYPRSEENNRRLGVFPKAPDLGSRAMLERADELFWHPSEVDVSIRPGWFYHKRQDGQVKSLKHLVDIYFQSVGYNSGLLLNVPPDRRGRISDPDSARLSEFAAYLDKAFSDDRVVGGEGLWEIKEGESREWRLRPGSRVNTLMLQENIAHGQRVDSFRVEALVKGEWTALCEGTTIGHKRLLRFPAVKASALRLTLPLTRSVAEISRVGAFYAEVLRENSDEAGFNDVPHEGWTVIEDRPLTVDLGRLYTLSGVSYIPDEAAHEDAARRAAGLPKGAQLSSEHLGYAFHYGVEVSGDGVTWETMVRDGEFGNIMYNPVPQSVRFDSKALARYVRFSAVTEEGKPAAVTPEEFGVVLSKPVDDETLLYADPSAPIVFPVSHDAPSVSDAVSVSDSLSVRDSLSVTDSAAVLFLRPGILIPDFPDGGFSPPPSSRATRRKLIRRTGSHSLSTRPGE